MTTCPDCGLPLDKHCQDCGYGFTRQEKHDAIDQAIKVAYADPDAAKSQRAIAASLPPYLRSDHKTVGKRIAKLQDAGELPHLKSAKAIDGKTYPTTKPTLNINPVENVIHANNPELLPEVERLHFQDGMTIADVCFGEGIFWRKVDTSRYDFRPSDLYKAGNEVAGHDCRDLPYEGGSIDVVVFDPPFINSGTRHRHGWMEKLYKTESLNLSPKQITALYEDGMREAYRVLSKGGLLLVKCKNDAHNWREIEVYQIAATLGMKAIDKFYLLPPTKKIQGHFTHKQKKQHTAVKMESILWVFRKPKVAKPQPVVNADNDAWLRDIDFTEVWPEVA